MKVNVEKMDELHVAVGHKCSEENPHEAFAAVEGEFHTGGAFTVECENCGKTIYLGIHNTKETAVEEATGRPLGKQTDESLANSSSTPGEGDEQSD